jgi:oxygen-independent coproporphyrinogen-3 oxidase
MYTSFDPEKVDVKKILSYNIPGPRYTSYPTAPMFKIGFTHSRYLELISRSVELRKPKGYSLYFHLPFCRRKCFYCGCNSMVPESEEIKNRYITYLKTEMQKVAGLLDRFLTVRQIHFGGGTPNTYPIDTISEIMEHVRGLFTVEKDCEVSIELDPRLIEEGYLKALEEAGFNRVSFGVQDLNEDVQRNIGRNQSREVSINALKLAKKRGFMGINVDLVYGLPGQSVESFEKTAWEIANLSPDRIALFNFAYLPSLRPNQRSISTDLLPLPEEKLRIFLTAVKVFEDAGYHLIGLDHFAKGGDSLYIAFRQGKLRRNFQGYTVMEKLDLFAFGVTGISQLKSGYAQNVKELDQYFSILDRDELPVFRGLFFTEDDVIRREVIEDIFCNLRVDKARIEREFNILFNDYFPDHMQRLKSLIDDGMVEIDDRYIRVTGEGQLLLRNIAMAFDRYLNSDSGKDVLYSKTV